MKLTVVPTLLGLALGLLFTGSCSDQELSRSSAKKAIEKRISESFQGFGTIKPTLYIPDIEISIAGTKFGTSERGSEVVAACGAFEHYFVVVEGGEWVVQIVDEGLSIFGRAGYIDRTALAGVSNYLWLELKTPLEVEVTGIREEGRQKVAEFSLGMPEIVVTCLEALSKYDPAELGDPPPRLGLYLDDLNALPTGGMAVFALWDDGWRMKEMLY